MRTAGEVDVERRGVAGESGEAFLQRDGVGLGIGGRILAAFVARAGDDAAGQAVGFREKPSRCVERRTVSTKASDRCGMITALPDGQPQLPLAVFVARSARACRCFALKRPTGTPMPRELRPTLRLAVDAQPALLEDGAARLAAVSGRRTAGKASFSGFPRGPLTPHFSSSDLFERRFLAVGAVTVAGEHPDHRGGDGHACAG